MRIACSLLRSTFRAWRPAFPVAALLVLIGVSFESPRAYADEISLLPFVGYSYGGTQHADIDPFRFRAEIEPAPQYGFGVAAYGHDYGLELIDHAQFTEVTLSEASIGELGRVDVSIHYILLQVVRQFPAGGVIPFLSLGLGGRGLYAAGESDWELTLGVGGGLRVRAPGGGSLRLAGRFFAPIKTVDNGFSFGAASRGLSIGNSDSIYQGDANLGYVLPIWRPRR